MRTFTQLVGSTASTSFTTYPSSFTSLAQNNSAANVALGGFLVNDKHRYLLQKYFNNERSSQTTTVGGMSLTLTGGLSIGATTATLSASWTYPTVTQLVNFSDGEQRTVLFTNGSTSISWTGGLTGTVTTAITSIGVQFYNIPSNISKVKDVTINVGQQKFTPVEVKTRQEWDIVNFLPYSSDIVQYFFIYNGQMGFFPIPSTTGNLITYNYKERIVDLSYADYSVGTLASSGMTIGSTTVTGTGTSWTVYPQNVDLTPYNLFIRADVATGGDGIWYPISQITSATTLVLVNPVINTPSITTSTTYTIAQLPLLSEDFQDMIVYGALMTYYSSIVKDEGQFKQYEALYNEKLELLAEYAGSKTALNVDLGQSPELQNANLFYYLSN